MTSGEIDQNRIQQALHGTKSIEDAAAVVAELAIEILSSDRAIVVLSTPSGAQISICRDSLAPQASQGIRSVFSLLSGHVAFDGRPVSLPLFLNEIEGANLEDRLIDKLITSGIRALGIVPILDGDETIGWIECHFRKQTFRWKKDHILTLLDLEEALREASSRLVVSSGESSVKEHGITEYRRLLDKGDVLFFKLSADFSIESVLGNTERVLGVTTGSIIQHPKVWEELLRRRSLRQLNAAARRGMRKKNPFQQELEIRNRESSSNRTLLFRAVPELSISGSLSGWEAIAVDTSEKKKVQRELLAERRRLEALYEVSRALQVNADPALVALQGLKALVSATNAHGGVTIFYDRSSHGLELVASEGLSGAFIDDIQRQIGIDGLIRAVVESGRGLVIRDIQAESRTIRETARTEGLRSAVLTPLLLDDNAVGAIVLYSRRTAGFTEADVHLVTAAASQICFAARRAEFYIAERRQSNSLAALYRLSHELSKHLTPKDIATHSFPIIDEEIPCKRMWLGITNDQGTHIVGQAGFGPGVDDRIQNVQIELALRHDFLDQALETGQPIIVDSGKEIECSGLNVLLKKLDLETFIIVPLMSLGQIVGVLVVEPQYTSTFFSQKRLPLLSSMSSEIASVILARRFEAKMAESEKMRMAGLLASGVAHNFNNVLQAVIGQASLIKMQLPKNSPIQHSAQNIVDSASKGASLIQQLSSLPVSGDRDKIHLDLTRILSESEPFYRSLLGRGVSFSLTSSEQSLEIKGELSQLQQALSNIIANAREAIDGNKNGRVEMTTASVRLRTGEIDPALPPGRYAQITVRDNGVGMSPDKVKRCFEPFYTTKDQDDKTGVGITGSGLGLSASYAIIKDHGGIITAQSEISLGSEFNVYLPLIDPRERREQLEEYQFENVPDVLLLNFDEPTQRLLLDEFEDVPLRALTGSKWKRAYEFSRLSVNTPRLLIVDADNITFSLEQFTRSLMSRGEALYVVLVTQDLEKFKEVLGEDSRILWYQKPMTKSIVRQLARQLFLRRKMAELARGFVDDVVTN